MQARMITKTGGTIAALFAIIPVLAAGTIKWIGPDGGDYYDAANWEGGVLPGADDTIVFDPGAGVDLMVTNELTAAAYTARPNGIKIAGVKVLSGNVRIIGTYAKDNAGDTYNLFRVKDDVTNEWYVAEGATLWTSHRPMPTTSGKGILMKTGAGTLQFDNFNWAASTGGSYRMEATIVEAGVIQLTRRYGIYSHHFYVKNGATLRARQYSWLKHCEVFHIEEGGVVELSELSSQYQFSGLEGAGELHIYSSSGDPKVELNLNGGPYNNFSGRIVKKGGAPSFRNYAENSNFPANEEAQHFRIGSSHMFDNFSAFLASIQPEFAGGIGTFYLPPIVASPGVVYNTEDVDGNPIELHANICTDSKYLDANGNFAKVIGPGSWYPENNFTLTGDLVQVTGYIGAPSDKTLYLGNGTDAAADVAAYPFGLRNYGTLCFQNVDPVELDNPVENVGTLSIKGDVTLSNLKPVSGGAISIDGTSGGVLRLRGDSEGVGSDCFFSNDAHLVLDGPGVSVHGADSQSANEGSPYRGMLKGPTGCCGRSGTAGSLLEVRNGAVFHHGRNSNQVMPPVRVTDGGRIVFHRSNGWMGPTSGVYESFVDGGYLEYAADMPIYEGYLFNDSTCDNLLLKVGEKGVFFVNTDTRTGRYASSKRAYCNIPITSGTEVGISDGGVSVEVGIPFVPTRPWNLQGAIKLGDVRFMVQKALVDLSSTQEPFGTSDFVMNPGAWMAFFDKDSEYAMRIAGREGGRMLLNGHARIDVQDISLSNRTQPVTLYIGRDGASTSSLAAGECGALTLDRDTDSKSICENFRVKVEGGVEMYADGRTKIPVFCWRGGTVDFATYDNDAGFTNFTGYVNNFNGGAESTVLVKAGDQFTLDEGETAIGALCVKMNGEKINQITIPAGSTLKIGNGTDTAVLLCQATMSNQSYVPFAGEGAIDFGFSTGMITSPMRNNVTYTRYIRLTNRITGWNGVVYSSANGNGCADDNTPNNAHFQLEAANDYTGGTKIDMSAVNASHKDCFSSGAVTVLGSRLGGGNVNFRCEGPFANDFTISCYGRRFNLGASAYGWESESWGALSFGVAGTRITGDVTIDGQSRISSYFPEAGSEVVVFEGEVKGGHLEIVDHDSERHHSYVFAHQNHSLTGGVEVLNGATAVLRGSGTLGPGRISLGNGTLRFENTVPFELSNELVGAGRMIVAGEGPVNFDCDMSKLKDFYENDFYLVEYARGRHRIGRKQLFNTISSFEVTGDDDKYNRPILVFDEPITYHVDPIWLCGTFEIELCPGAKLDFGDPSVQINVYRFSGNRDDVIGIINEENPKLGCMLIVR